LTHLSFVVDDVDAAARELETFGGTIIEGTRSGQDDPDTVQIIFLADPDGTAGRAHAPGEGPSLVILL
jgi:predicted enzyme related to lactoylglutathione lyase